MNINLDYYKLSVLHTRYQMIIYVLIIVLSFLIASFLANLYFDHKTNLGILKKKEILQLQTYQNHLKQIEESDVLLKKIKELNQSIVDVLQGRETDFSAPLFISELNQTALKRDIRVLKSEPQKITDNELYSQHQVKLEGCGTYAQIYHFIHDLSQNKRIITVDHFVFNDVKKRQKTHTTFNLKNSANSVCYEKNSVSFVAHLSMYRLAESLLQQNDNESIIISPIQNKNINDPFAISDELYFLLKKGNENNHADVTNIRLKNNPYLPKDYKANPLENYELKDLIMRGVLMDKNGNKTALVEANKAVFSVYIGDFIGKDFGKVIEINEDNIVLIEVYGLEKNGEIKAQKVFNHLRLKK